MFRHSVASDLKFFWPFFAAYFALDLLRRDRF
jgi:hypothetical protein